MALTGGVISDAAFLGTVLQNVLVQADDAISPGRGGDDGQFEGIERDPGIAVGDVAEKIERLVSPGNLELAQPSLRVCQSLSDDLADLTCLQRLRAKRLERRSRLC